MPANEFEKQVQQRLDEFQLNPSASVWEKVEDELRNKRKRRVIFFILLPAMVGLLGFSVYYLLSTGRSASLAEQMAKKDAGAVNSPSPADKDNAVKTKNETNSSSSTETTQPADGGKENLVGSNQTIIENKKLNISYPVTQT